MNDPLPPATRPDARLVRAAFDAAAARYDDCAVLQREVGTRLLERLDLVKLVPARVLDLGCGTGLHTRALLDRYPQALVCGADLAPAMCARTRARPAAMPIPNFVANRTFAGLAALLHGGER